MSFQYERDDGKQRIVVTFQGDFDLADGLAVLERSRLEDVGTYGVLYDVRGWTRAPGISDLRHFMSKETANIPTKGSRGPIAILVTDPVMYNMACTYAVLGGPALQIRVFRDSREADSWLVEKTVL